ncbi:cation:dicarboxylate symporter family transporter [Kocuria marina]|uniref:cation:dicarboxylate symporter family transporter n=1 Tax=Kocuria marina TaxID=223184 RepID=UPI0011A40BA9|nr:MULTISPECIES: cation:dicarboxylase symporter family transporter [Kocuria]MCT2020686.1 cation:dicarboxylase symporter family transporter [Kocuria marina]
MSDTRVRGSVPGGARAAGGGPRKKDRTHYLYIFVIAGVVLGALIGLLFPDVGVALKPLGTGFIALIKMMIAPVIFCTIVLGVGSIAHAATVGKVGGLALTYFIVMSTFALAIGLVVGNIVQPGSGLDLASAHYDSSGLASGGDHSAEGGAVGFVLGIVPTTLFSALTSGNILQTLLVALLVGFALQAMGESGKPVLKAVTYIQAVVFRLLMMVMWLAPIGALGAIAAVVGATGMKAIVSMIGLMLAFYVTCILFIVVVLGLILKLVSGVNIFSLMRYLAREYLLIFSTSSSEAALPRLIAKMEHLGVSKPVVGVVVPTGYSFNLDGTAIYLTMGALFVADAMGKPLALGEQITLLLFMIIASKGAAGVSGAGIATLAAGLQSHRPDLVDGVGLIVGIDRFMSEARALTNFSGNAVATLVLGTWVKQVDKDRVRRVLSGAEPFDEESLTADPHASPTAPEQALEGHPGSRPVTPREH